LHIHLDELGESVLIQIENEVMNEVEPVTDSDERKLIGELRFLEEVLGL
jgi:hypothetical protein